MISKAAIRKAFTDPGQAAFPNTNDLAKSFTAKLLVGQAIIVVVTQLSYDNVLALLGCILQGVYGSTQLIKVLVGTLQAIVWAPSSFVSFSAQTSASRIFEALDVNCTYNICVLTYLQIQDIHCQGLVTKKLNCRGGSKAGAFLKNFANLLQGFSGDLFHMV